MFAAEDLINCRVAPCLVFGGNLQRLDFGPCAPVNLFHSSVVLDRQVAQQAVDDSAQRRDLDKEVGRPARIRHRHVFSSFVRVAATKVAGRTGRVIARGPSVLALLFPLLLVLCAIGAFSFATHLRGLASRGELQVLSLGGGR